MYTNFINKNKDLVTCTQQHHICLHISAQNPQKSDLRKPLIYVFGHQYTVTSSIKIGHRRQKRNAFVYLSAKRRMNLFAFFKCELGNDGGFFRIFVIAGHVHLMRAESCSCCRRIGLDGKSFIEQAFAVRRSNHHPVSIINVINVPFIIIRN